MIRHVKNIKRISIKNMVSVVDALFLLVVRVALGEFDELFTI
jgi:hypothetical protein